MGSYFLRHSLYQQFTSFPPAWKSLTLGLVRLGGLGGARNSIRTGKLSFGHSDGSRNALSTGLEGDVSLGFELGKAPMALCLKP